MLFASWFLSESEHNISFNCGLSSCRNDFTAYSSELSFKEKKSEYPKSAKKGHEDASLITLAANAVA